MPHPILYANDHYVVLRPGQAETLVTVAEMITILKTLAVDHPELQLQTDESHLRSLLEDTCELDLGADQWIQWYAVRLEV